MTIYSGIILFLLPPVVVVILYVVVHAVANFFIWMAGSIRDVLND